MGIFERYLSLWVGFAMITGVLLGNVAPRVFEQIASLEVAHVNMVVAVLIWLMITPMMIQIDFKAVKNVGKKPKGLLLTLVINWLIKPFTMALLAWLFFRVIFSAWVEPGMAGEYMAGMILLGVAPCTAMVFVWSQMTRGDPNYTLVQVSVNNVIMVFAFAPLAALLLGINAIAVPWLTLLLSVVLYVLLPLVAGILIRTLWLKVQSRKSAPQSLSVLMARCKPWSILGLLATVGLLFGLQAPTILAKPLIIGLIAIPLLLQTYGIFALSYWLAPVSVF